MNAICAYCQSELNTEARDGRAWLETVNLTPDALFIECNDWPFDGPVVEADVALDWCNLVCFGRWIYRAAVHLASPQRPEEYAA